jgi:tartrate dehydrogenase/decarboxylase/D-malate dehydrogenase
MTTHRIALYPGDGIGREVLGEAVRVLEKVAATDGFTLDMTEFPWGADYYLEHGVAAPADYLETLRQFDAIFLGALGDPARIPDHITLEPLVRIRQSFDQYACVRPCRSFPGVPSLLAAEHPIDMVVVRENSEGEYVVCGGRIKTNQPQESAIQTSVHTRQGIERILRFGFDLARTRRRRLTMATKSNALRYGMVLWDEIFEEVRCDYSDVESDRQHADAAAMNFVRWPERFDVVVASNLFGDILSDLAGAITGGLGLAPSANIHPERGFPSMFEPVHGSAPDIAGQGIANPIAAILSAAQLLSFLGQEAGAKRIRDAVEAALSAGARTPDLGGDLGTSAMTEAIFEGL